MSEVIIDIKKINMDIKEKYLIVNNIVVNKNSYNWQPLTVTEKNM